MLISSIRDHDPVTFLESTRLYRLTAPVGKARIVQEGKNVTVIAGGKHALHGASGSGGIWC